MTLSIGLSLQISAMKNGPWLIQSGVAKFELNCTKWFQKSGTDEKAALPNLIEMELIELYEISNLISKKLRCCQIWLKLNELKWKF